MVWHCSHGGGTAAWRHTLTRHDREVPAAPSTERWGLLATKQVTPPSRHGVGYCDGCAVSPRVHAVVWLSALGAALAHPAGGDGSGWFECVPPSTSEVLEVDVFALAWAFKAAWTASSDNGKARAHPLRALAKAGGARRRWETPADPKPRGPVHTT